MAGFSWGPAIEGDGEEDYEKGNLKNQSVPADLLDPCLAELDQFFSLPDFESIECLFKDFDQNMAAEDSFDANMDSISRRHQDSETFSGIGESNAALSMENMESSTHKDSEKTNESDGKFRSIGCLLEKGLDKVSLDGASDCKDLSNLSKNFDQNMAAKYSFDVDMGLICRGDQDSEDFGNGGLTDLKNSHICSEKTNESGGKLSSFSGNRGSFVALSMENVESSTDANISNMGSEKTNECDGKLRSFGSLIEKGLEKVSLYGASDCCKDSCDLNECQTCGEGGVNFEGTCVRSSRTDSTKPEVLIKILDDALNCDDANTENNATLHSSSSSTSYSCCSDEEDDNEKERSKANNGEGSANEETDKEEGEITIAEADDMIAWDDEDDEQSSAGPIKSKNELELLLLVPPVTMTLESHHQTVVVGKILSIVGSKVIVEGLEKHNPLNEGSILWINETRLPLGIVDEIFGPVKNPYYVVRFNSDDEVPLEIGQGTVISFVEEFAGHVLNDKNLHQKGYDASGDNDEEISNEEEFSDDEKEAEYRRMLKMKKRGTNELIPENNIKKERNVQMSRNKNWNRNRSKNQNSVAQTSLGLLKAPGDLNLRAPFPVAANSSSMDPQRPRFCAPNGIWNNGFPPQQLQNPIFPNMWMQGTQPYQNHIQASLPVPQQPLNFNNMVVQPNIGMNQACVPPWPAGVDHNILNMLQFAVGLQSLQNPSQIQTVPNLQPSPAPIYSGGRRGQFRGGRGDFRRGRGRGRGRY